jgi:hypothetical protein
LNVYDYHSHPCFRKVAVHPNLARIEPESLKRDTF